MSAPEELFALQVRAARLPAPTREGRFHPTRKWRFDYCWPERLLAVEIDGGIYTQGRHARGAGIEADCEKYCEAVLRGWRVLRFTPAMVRSGAALGYVERMLA